MANEFDELPENRLSDDEKALLLELPEMAEMTDFGESRRRFLGQMSATGLGLFAMQLLAEEQALGALEMPEGAVFAPPVAEENAVAVKLKINGVEKTLTPTDARPRK